MAKALPLAFFKVFQDNYSENQSIFFLKKTQFQTVWVFFILPVTFYGKCATFKYIEKFQHFFPKNQTNFPKKPSFRNFFKKLIFQQHSTTSLLFLKIFEIFQIFFEKPIFFPETTQLLIVLKIPTSSVAYYGDFDKLGDFNEKHFFLQKSNSCKKNSK